MSINYSPAYGVTSTGVRLPLLVDSTGALVMSSGVGVINVTSPAYGAKGDGTTDNTAAIASAIQAAVAAGGGIVFFPPGIYVTGNQTLQAHVFIVGSGKTATIIQLKNSVNTDLFSAQTNLINLSASGGSGVQGTLFDFGLASLTLDGNKANQSSGPSYPLRFYGYSYIMRDLEIKNGFSGNIQSDWNGGNNFGSADSMVSQWVNVKAHNSGGIGVEFGGPHDSQFVNCEFFRDASHIMHLAPNSNGFMFKNSHFWGPGLGAASGITLQGQDDFERANQSGLGTASDGHSWTDSGGGVTSAIASQRATFTGNGGEADTFYTLGVTSTDSDFFMLLNQGTDGSNVFGVTMRYTDANNSYRAVVSAGNIFIQKIVAGVKSTLISHAFTHVAGNVVGLRVRIQGTTISAKAWDIATTTEPAAFIATTTDSAFASGLFGIMAFVNSGTMTAFNYRAYNVYTQSGKVCILQESQGCQYDGCSAESSDTLQWVLLANNTQWMGGSLYDGTPSSSSGVQIGFVSGDTAYAGQILSGNITPFRNTIQGCLLTDCQGSGGSIVLRNDGGYNLLDVTVNQDGFGYDLAGAINVRSNLREMYNDGTNITSGRFLLDAGLQVNKSGTLYSGSGAPASTLGVSGDYYFRTDTPNTANQRLYVNNAGTWTGIV